jgi:hypothetical protein
LTELLSQKAHLFSTPKSTMKEKQSGFHSETLMIILGMKDNISPVDR